MAHLGFIEIAYRENYGKGVELMSAALNGDDERVKTNNKWYYHLGDALQRLNRTDEV